MKNIVPYPSDKLTGITPGARKPKLAFSTPDYGVISPRQLQAARGMLNWSRNQCGAAANVSPETIKNIETRKFVPAKQTNDSLIQAFAAQGVEFLSFINIRLHSLSGQQLTLTEKTVGVLCVLQSPESV